MLLSALQCECAQDDLQGFCACSEKWASGKNGVGSQGSLHAYAFKSVAEFRVRSSCEQPQAGSVSISISQAFLLLIMT